MMLGKKKIVIVVAAIALIVLLGARLIPKFKNRETQNNNPAHQQIIGSPVGSFVRIGSTTIAVEIADTEQKQQEGLSNRPSLDADRGMLFVFPKADYYPFWMPDMHFPLDIIWIGADKKIISISENIPPLLDKTKPTYYLSPKPAQYVLEVKAGFAKKHNIKIGDTVEM